MSDQADYVMTLLGAAMRDRRLELGLTQLEAVNRAGKGISVPLWSKMENGHPGRYRDSSFAAIDRALDWPRDSAINIARRSAEPIEGDIEVALTMDEWDEMIRFLAMSPSNVSHVLARKIAKRVGRPLPTEFVPPRPGEIQPVRPVDVMAKMAERERTVDAVLAMAADGDDHLPADTDDVRTTRPQPPVEE